MTKTFPFYIIFFNILTIFSQTGVVIDVIDGDTVSIKSSNSMARKEYNIAYINSPELDQDFGMEAKQHLVNILMNEKVSFYIVNDDIGDEIDTKIGYRKKKKTKSILLYYGNGMSIGKQLIREGYAWAKKEIGLTKNTYINLKKLESRAKKKKLGLWYNKKALYPSYFVYHGSNKKRTMISNNKY